MENILIQFFIIITLRLIFNCNNNKFYDIGLACLKMYLQFLKPFLVIFSIKLLFWCYYCDSMFSCQIRI